MQTCKEHGDSAIVCYEDNTKCPACELLIRIQDLKDEIESLESENNDLMQKVDEKVEIDAKKHDESVRAQKGT